MNPQAQVASYEGRYIDYDGYYGDQCMDLILQYCADIGGPRLSGNAADTYGQHAEFYAPIGVVTPQPGDIAVFQRDSANGYAGHISLVYSADGGSFVSMDQNWGTPYCMYVRHGYSSLIGFMRPILFAGAMAQDQTSQIQDLFAQRGQLQADVTKLVAQNHDLTNQVIDLNAQKGSLQATIEQLQQNKPTGDAAKLQAKIDKAKADLN